MNAQEAGGCLQNTHGFITAETELWPIAKFILIIDWHT